MEKAELKKLLLESTEKVLFELGKILDKNSSLYNELVILWKRHDDIEREIRLGTIGFQEASIENNKVIDSLLKLIDKTNEVDITNKNEKKEIPIEEAIEWLENVLLKYSYTYDDIEKRKKIAIIFKKKPDIHLYSFIYKKINILTTGEFTIVTDKQSYSDENQLFQKKNNVARTSSICRNQDISGKLQDISRIVIRKDYHEKNIFLIECKALNYKKAFRIITKLKYQTNSIDFSNVFDGTYDSFEIQFNDLSLAKKVADAIYYLSIHFGAKGDAF